MMCEKFTSSYQYNPPSFTITLQLAVSGAVRYCMVAYMQQVPQRPLGMPL